MGKCIASTGSAVKGLTVEMTFLLLLSTQLCQSTESVEM